MSKTWFGYWQVGKNHRVSNAKVGDWIAYTQSAQAAIKADHQPEFVTALWLDRNIGKDEQIDYSELIKINYKGPLYIDFDGDLEKVLSDVRKFFKTLSQLGVTPGEVRMYLTGGRGVHIEIPEGVFIEKPSDKGYPMLPAIYKEMVFEFAEDTTDLAVYSSSRGRMWRTVNVPNERKIDGETVTTYKVQFDANRLDELTPKSYRELCSAPRPEFELGDARYAPRLGEYFLIAREKVDKSANDRAKRRGQGTDWLKAYGGKVPQALLRIMRGEDISPDAGFNKIAIQLALAATTLAIDENEFVSMCEGLVENHSSDPGSRYGSPEKRRRELRRLHRYYDGNPCYEYSVGGVRSILVEGTNVDELDASGAPAIESEQENIAYSAMHLGYSVRKSGIYKNTKQGEDFVHVLVSSVGISDVSELLDAKTGESRGFHVKTHYNGKPSTEHYLNNNDFFTRQAFTRALGSQGFVHIPDAQVGALQEILKAMSDVTGNSTILLPLEGFNVMSLDALEPESTSGFRVRWADATGVDGILQEGEKKVNYRMGTREEGGTFRTDLRNAPDLEKSEELRDYYREFLSWFRPETTAKVVGWYVAAFAAQHIRAGLNQFPLLQSYGEAGSGKSTFNRMCSNLHYYRRPPYIINTPLATRFGLSSALGDTGSLPVVFDEVKQREMTKDLFNTVASLARANFDGSGGAKGAIRHDAGRSEVVVNRSDNLAPLSIISEALIGQEAVIQRSVTVNFPSMHANTRNSLRLRRFFMKVSNLGLIGNAIRKVLLGTSVEDVCEMVLTEQEELSEYAHPRTPDRTVFAYAVASTGIRMLGGVLRRTFGSDFDETIDKLKDSLRRDIQNVAIGNLSEINRVLDILADITHGYSPYGLEFKLGNGYDYTRYDGEVVLEIDARAAWLTYESHCRNAQCEKLFDDSKAFAAALNNHPNRNRDMPPSAKTSLGTAGVLGTRVIPLRVGRLAAENPQMEMLRVPEHFKGEF